MLTYTCPFGGSVIRAESQSQLEAKIWNHNLYAHSPTQIVVCAGTLPWAAQTPNERMPKRQEPRPFRLSGRGL